MIYNILSDLLPIQINNVRKTAKTISNNFIQVIV